MQDSIELPSQQQIQNHNQFQFQQIISPKGRRLTKVNNFNTASHQSLAYSNSTQNKNFIQRSPPFFSLESLNNQNINTLNFSRPIDRKQFTYGSQKGGMMIQFDKIKEESYISNVDEDNNNSRFVHKRQKSGNQEKIQLPCFLSNENSPANKYSSQNLNQQEDSLNNSKQYQKDQVGQQTVKNKNYTKINPSSKKQIKQAITKSLNQKINSAVPKDVINKNGINKKVKQVSTPIMNQSMQSRFSKSPITTKSNKSSSFSHNQENKNQTNPNDNHRNRSPYLAQKNQNFPKTRSKSPIQIRTSDEVINLRQKIKQLQYALQVQTISTQELRTKVTVLNELLEQKFLQKNGINFKLFKNSFPSHSKTISKDKVNNSKSSNKDPKDSKNLSNIDLYVQMKIIQKSKQQLQIQFDRVKQELEQKTKQLKTVQNNYQELNKRYILSQKSKNEIKTQTSFSSYGQTQLNQDNNRQTVQQKFSSLQNQFELQNLKNRVSQLQQQRQTLMQYIQNQKKLLQKKDQQVRELKQKTSQSEQKNNTSQAHLKLLEQKQKRFLQIERPRFITQIRELTEKLDGQREQIERLEMENNLRNMNISLGSNSKRGYGEGSRLDVSGIEPTKREIEGDNGVQQGNNERNSLLKDPSFIYDEKNNKNSSSKSSPNKTIEHFQQIKNKQIAPDAISLIMMQQQQLKILKNQRDYFREQNQKLIQLKQQNYVLKLKNQDLENELHSIHQLLQVEDDLTF